MVNEKPVTSLNGSAEKPKASLTGDAVLDFLQGDGAFKQTNSDSTSSVHSPHLNGNQESAAVEGEEEELSDSEVAELLKQLEEAEEVASGLEDRLDGLLQNLDGLLLGLQPPSNDRDKRGEGNSKEPSTKPGSEP